MDDLLPFLKTWAQNRSSVRAVLLTSSRAIPGARVDALSDYDVILVVKDIQPYVRDRSWLSDFGEVLVAYWDPAYPDPAYGLPVCGNVTQYAGGLHIDFTLWPVELLKHIVDSGKLTEELEAGYRVLLDKDGMTEKLPTPGYQAYIPKPPTQEEYLTLINDFLSDAPYVAKCLWRGELLLAKWCLDYDMRYIYLLKMLEWRMEMKHGWQARAEINGKQLKEKLPSGTWEKVERTMAGAGLEENWQALLASLELMLEVGREVGEHLGYAYSEEMHAGVVRYVEEVRGMKRIEH